LLKYGKMTNGLKHPRGTSISWNKILVLPI
jgi:hypothetical protein